MRNSLRLLPALALVALTAATARAAIVSHPRVYNDVPGSTLTIVNNGVNAVDVTDVGVSAPTGFANRSDFAISDGATGEVFGNSDYFVLSADVMLAGDPISPRKEAGIRVNNSVGGDFLFILNTDGHEVVSFGGPGPFHNFRADGHPNFNSGDIVTMTLNYCQDPNGTIDPLTGKIRNGVVMGADGFFTSFLPMFNLENGFLDNSQIAFYEQCVNDPNTPTNSIHAAFRNVSFARTDGQCIPEPGSLSLLAAGLLPLLGLRRRK